MRIIIPLYGFELESIDEYSFDNIGITIGPMLESDIIRIPLFSEQDLSIISNDAQWAIFYNGNVEEGYKSNINLLLMAFKIFCSKRYPHIKHRICSESPSLCARFCDTITYNYSYPRVVEPYSKDDLDSICKGFISLIEMDKISVRTHNALYFLYRAWHNTKWMDSFLLMMCSIESLFSKDRRGGATSTITTRVSSLLQSKARCTKRDIESLYDLRSRMTHGNIIISDDPGENLKQLEHLEYVTIECFRTLIEKGYYKKYSDKDERNTLMNTLNST
jgi:hypothetical protein